MSIIECSKETWDSFVKLSRQGTIFSSSLYLECYELPIKYLLCKKGEETIGGFACIESNTGIEPLPYLVYNGVMFDEQKFNKQYRLNEIRFSVTQDFSEYLFDKYANIFFINHYSVADIRPFDWFNYGQHEKGYYSMLVNYTSLLDISNPEDVSGYASGRKEGIRKCQKEITIKTIPSKDLAILDDLHNKTFLRQGIKRSELEVKAFRNLTQNLLNEDKAQLFITYFNENPVNASFFCYDFMRAYYLFGASDPEFRKLDSATGNLFFAFNFLAKELGIKEVDMVGVNSPQRGSFKLGFGGTVTPYFIITKVPVT